jgi:hypothetical protein
LRPFRYIRIVFHGRIFVGILVWIFVVIFVVISFWIFDGIFPKSQVIHDKIQVETGTIFFLIWLMNYLAKGQLVSKCPLGVFKSSKKPTNFFPGFLP